MTWLYFWNFFLFQWLFFRVTRQVNNTGVTTGYGVLMGVVPLTGWWSNYILVRFNR